VANLKSVGTPPGPRHDKTLIGLPVQKPNTLPPLRASTLAPLPVHRKPEPARAQVRPEPAPAQARPDEPAPVPARPGPAPVPSPQQQPTPAPSKREPSLVILSRQLVNAVRRPEGGVRFKAPGPPPRSDGASSQAARQRRHSTDPTDYNVQIVSLHAAPPLPAKRPLGEGDASWAADMEGITNSKARARGLFVFAGVALVCAVAFAIYWR